MFISTKEECTMTDSASSQTLSMIQTISARRWWVISTARRSAVMNFPRGLALASEANPFEEQYECQDCKRIYASWLANISGRSQQ